jgi:hypothetical protein
MDRDELALRCMTLPEVTPRQAFDLVRVALDGGPKYVTRSVFKALSTKGLLMGKGSGSEVPAYTHHKGERLAFLILIAAQLAAQEQEHG